MSKKTRKVLCRAKVRNINPVSGQYSYAKDEFTFTIGKGCRFQEVPKHWEEIKGSAVVDSPSEVETLMDLQIKNMTVGRIAQFMMVYYGIKIELGQAQDTAYRQAIGYIRDPKCKRRPDSEILAGLATIENDTPARDETGPGPIPSGKPSPVVPDKDDDSVDDSDSKENAAASGEKLFKKLNADEIDGLSREDIFAKVKRMYKVEMGNTGNKTVVLNKAYEIEIAALDSKGVLLDRDK